MIQEDIQKTLLLACEKSHLVFVDGCFSLELSCVPERLEICSLQQEAGVMLCVPPGERFESPLQVLFVHAGAASQISAPRLHGMLGKGSHLSCAFTTRSLCPQTTHCADPSLNFILEEDSSLHLAHGEVFSKTRASLDAIVKKNARLHSVRVAQGGERAQYHYRVQLQEEGAYVDLSGLALLEQSQKVQVQVRIEHEAPHTYSMQLFKDVLRGSSHSCFSGNIEVHSRAQKTRAYQLHKTLLLSPYAIVRSQPHLEIGADDVQASHGASVAQMDDRQLFYFQTRGISRERATELLVEGFCQEVLEKTCFNLLTRKSV